VQHIKIYLPCNFEVNPITYFDRLCKLEKRGDEIKKKIFSSETTEPISTKLDGADGYNFERGPPKDHFSKVWLRLAQ
jgi:hypothetical protein